MIIGKQITVEDKFKLNADLIYAFEKIDFRIVLSVHYYGYMQTHIACG